MRFFIRRISLGLGLQFALLNTVLAASIDDGVQAIDNGDYVAAYKIFEELANTGDREAEYNLALMYKQGRGAMQDADKAAKWFRKSADQGLSEAQFYLGYMYDEGEGVEQSYEYAAVWYRKAAEQGHALAQSNLGLLYANGQGVKQDLLLAYVWFHLASAQGVTAASKNQDVVAEELSPELLENAKGLVQTFFERYVMPFQSQHVAKHRRRLMEPPAAAE